MYPDEEIRQRSAVLLQADAANYTTPGEFFEHNMHFFSIQPRRQYTPGPNDSLLVKSIDILSIRFEEVSIAQWDETSLRQIFDSAVDEMSKEWAAMDPEHSTSDVGSCKGAVQHFLRWALTGGNPGPGLMLSMSLLGRTVSLSRVRDATATFKSTMS